MGTKIRPSGNYRGMRQGMPPTPPQMPVQPIAPAAPDIEALISQLPPEHQAAIRAQWAAYAPPTPPTFAPINVAPQGAMEGMAQSLGPHPFNMPQGYMRGGAGGAFLTGLASGFGNALTARGATSYQNRIGQAQAAQQAQKTAYDQSAAENRGARAGMLGQITAAGLRPTKPDKPVETSTDRARAAEQAGARARAKRIVGYLSDPTSGNRDTPASMMVEGEIDKINPQFNRVRATAMFNNAKDFYKSTNGVQFTTRRAAIITVGQHIKEFENLLGDLEKRVPRGDVRIANLGVIGAAQQGLLGVEAQQAVNNMKEVAIPIVGREINNVLTGSSVSTEKDRAEAQAILNLFSNPKVTRSNVESAKRLLSGRARAVQNLVPFAGGKNNPYLINTSAIKMLDDVYKGNQPEGAGIFDNSTVEDSGGEDGGQVEEWVRDPKTKKLVKK